MPPSTVVLNLKIAVLRRIFRSSLASAIGTVLVVDVDALWSSAHRMLLDVHMERHTAFRHFMTDTRLGCSRSTCHRQSVEGSKRVTHSEDGWRSLTVGAYASSISHLTGCPLILPATTSSLASRASQISPRVGQFQLQRIFGGY